MVSSNENSKKGDNNRSPFFSQNLDRPVLGVILLLIATSLIIGMNAFAKSISEYYNPIEIVFIRNFLGAFLISFYLFASRKTHLFKTQKPYGQIARAIAGTAGLALVFWGYSVMPMADMQALMMTGGLISLCLAPIVLKEQVGVWRWGAALIGFLGALFIIQPGGEAFLGWNALIGLGAAFLGSAVIGLLLRSLGKTEHAYTTVFYFMIIGSLILLPYILYSGGTYVAGTYIGIIGVAIAGVLSLMLKTQAYRFAEASLLSPVHYSGIVWAMLFGWIFFAEVPSFYVWVGSILIVASNLLIIYRENKKSLN